MSFVIFSSLLCFIFRHAEEEKLALKNSLVGADERLATMENLQADAVDRGKELKTCQEQKSAREEALRTERGRTHHLVRFFLMPA